MGVGPNPQVLDDTVHKLLGSHWKVLLQGVRGFVPKCRGGEGGGGW